MVTHALLIGLVLAFSPTRLEAHPIHTSLTELTVSGQTLRATVRVFADDLAAALSRRRGDVRSDADVSAYVLSSIAFVDEGGRVVVSRGCGVKRTGELLWVCVEATVTADKASLRNTLLCETFSDQVNIVRASAGGRTRNLVYVRGDSAKRIS